MYKKSIFIVIFFFYFYSLLIAQSIQYNDKDITNQIVAQATLGNTLKRRSVNNNLDLLDRFQRNRGFFIGASPIFGQVTFESRHTETINSNSNITKDSKNNFTLGLAAGYYFDEFKFSVEYNRLDLAYEVTSFLGFVDYIDNTGFFLGLGFGSSIINLPNYLYQTRSDGAPILIDRNLQIVRSGISYEAFGNAASLRLGYNFTFGRVLDLVGYKFIFDREFQTSIGFLLQQSTIKGIKFTAAESDSINFLSIQDEFSYSLSAIYFNIRYAFY